MARADVGTGAKATWRFEHSAESAGSADRIWQRYADVERWSEWSPGVQWSRLDGPFEVGSEGRTLPPRSPVLRFRIVVVEPPRTFVTEARLPGARLRFEHILEQVELGTRITHRATLSGPLSAMCRKSVARRTESGLTASVERLAAMSGAPG